jgi:hypothetical protein
MQRLKGFVNKTKLKLMLLTKEAHENHHMLCKWWFFYDV